MVLLEIGPVDQNQRLGDSGKLHSAQRGVHRTRLLLQMPVAEQAVGPLDGMAQAFVARKASPDVRERQPRSTDAADHGFEQRPQAACVNARKRGTQAAM
ncbi:MAG: hypothetical protein WAK53_14430 [Chromatiaceae bacterium]